jgi:hypothetical protein
MNLVRVTCGAALVVLSCVSSAAQAQERKIEISPFAGGYFSAGFQSFQTVQLLPTPVIREARPVDEPNSGIFGVRASYDLTPRFALEGAFGFSPAGLSSSPAVGAWTFTSISDFLMGRVEPAAAVVVGPSPFRGKDTFSYSGNVVFHWRKANGWTPFLTGGLGAAQRTGELALPAVVIPVVVPILLPEPQPAPTFPPSPRPGTTLAFSTPSPSETDFSVNFGGGVKKYFNDRYGIRIDFRNYTSEVGDDTVNNIEVSLGLILRM